MVRKTKKILAILLALSMTMSMVTLGAMATEEGKCPQIDQNGDHKHDASEVLKEATCLEEGIITYYCKECLDGYGTDTESIPKTPHVPGEKELVNQASCTEKGNWTVRCKECGCELDYLTNPQWEPNFAGQKWENIGNGQHRMICKNCDGSPQGHSITEACKDSDGDGKCDGCGEELKKQCDQIDEFGNHKLKKEETPATCTEPGLIIWSCDKCGYYEKEEIPASGHQTMIVVDNRPTCTEKGNGHEVCSVCHVVVESKEIPPLGHDWGEWETTIVETCTKGGEEKHSCQREGCTATEDREIPAAGHKWSGTWTYNGDAHWHVCEVCGEKQEDSEGDHAWDEGVVTTQPTYTTEGVRTFTCTVCGHTRTEPVPALVQPSTPSISYYTLTIRYVDTEGNTVAETVTRRLAEGSSYSISSPTVENMTPDQEAVSGTLNSALTVTVTYAAVEDLEETQPPLTEAPTESPEPTEPGEEDLEEVEDLEETDTPLAELPDEFTEEEPIEEDMSDAETPLAEVPQTGDTLVLWVALALLSAAGLAWVSMTEKKGKRVQR